MAVPGEFKLTRHMTEFTEFSIEREFECLPPATIYIDSSTTTTPNAASRNSSSAELSASISSVRQVSTQQETQDFSNESKSPASSSLSREDSEISANLPQVRNTIHWLSPTTMIACLLAAGSLSIGHHCYYQWLSEQVVGSTNKQQYALGIGNGFAISIVFLCKNTIGIAYTQYLWRLLRLTPVSLMTINDAFGVAGNFFSLLNWEFVCKMPLGTMLALTLWLLPLTSLFTPATLSIDRAEFKNFKNSQVLNIGLYNKSLETAFYPRDGSMSAPTFARTLNAVAASAQQMQPVSPLPSQANMSYQLQAYAPLFRCSSVNSTLYEAYFQILKYYNTGMKNSEAETPQDRALMNSTSSRWVFGRNTKVLTEFSYHATIPWGFAQDVRHVSNISSKNPTRAQIIVRNAVRLLETMRSQLVIAINPDDTGMQMIQCGLHNVSITFGVEFINSVGTFTNVRREWLNPLALSENATSRTLPRNVTKLEDGRNVTKTVPGTHDTHTIFNKLFDEFVFFFQGSIQVSRFPQPSILLLAKFFLGNGISDTLDVNRMLNRMTRNTTRAVLYPVAERGRNKTMAETVEDFSLNVTLSTLSDPILWQMANVTISTTHTVYLYESKNLIISYSIVIFASALAVFLGSYAFVKNGVSHDASVSSFATTMQDLKVRNALVQHPGGAQPLDKRLGKLRLRFKPREGFEVVD